MWYYIVNIFLNAHICSFCFLGRSTHKNIRSWWLVNAVLKFCFFGIHISTPWVSYNLTSYQERWEVLLIFNYMLYPCPCSCNTFNITIYANNRNSPLNNKCSRSAYCVAFMDEVVGVPSYNNVLYKARVPKGTLFDEAEL